MKILVTGGLGTIGTVLVRELEARGHHVTIADLPHHHAHNYVRCDVAEKAEVDRIMGYTFDVVYHLAAEFGRWKFLFLAVLLHLGTAHGHPFILPCLD